MTDGSSGPSRRAFVAMAGSVALAGCGGENPLSDDSPTTIDAAALREVVAGDPPTVPERLPVTVEASAVDERVAAAREALSSVPASFGPDEVPNGAIRAELTRMREEATEAFDAVEAADAPAEAFEATRRVREAAAAVSAAWRAVEGSVDADEVRGRVPAVRSDVDAFRSRWRYVGDEPIRAVLAHAEVETRVAYAGRRLPAARERGRESPSNPVSLGEFAGEVAAARASLDDGAYVFDRYAASLDDARAVGTGLRRAGETLTATMNDRRDALPPADADPSSYVDPNVEGTVVEYALADLRDGIEYADRIDDERATGQRANVVLSAFWTLTRVRAFERLRERVDAGDHVTVESADDVRRLREAAFDAVEWARDAGEQPRLTRVVLRLADWLDHVADRITRDADDEVRVERIDRDVATYVVVRAMAREAPDASAEVADAIRSTVR